MKFDYTPLTTGLQLKESPIHGLGLFATEDFKAGIFLGETHIWEERRREFIRTPLGGFINHSEDPNCFINTNIHYHSGDQRELYTTRPIYEGEELTVYYTLLQE
jgi:SET domain-containing protein